MSLKSHLLVRPVALVRDLVPVLVPVAGTGVLGRVGDREATSG